MGGTDTRHRTGTPDEFLAHYGVKGMRWGFRKRRDGTYKKTKSKMSQENSEDYEQSRASLSRNLASLSNAELQQLNTRMQLEQSYSQLTQKRSTIAKGAKYANSAMKVAKFGESAYNTYNSPAGKAAREALKSYTAS